MSRPLRRCSDAVSRQPRSVRAVLALCLLALFGSACGPAATDSHATGSSMTVVDPDAWPYFFDREPYIHPTVIGAFQVWMSDKGDQVVAVNLLDAQGSNRFFGDVTVHESSTQKPTVSYDNDDEGFIAYRLVGITDQGMAVIVVSEGGGGSGVFRSLQCYRMRRDQGLSVDWSTNTAQRDRQRMLLYYLGSLPLGDRWSGDLRIVGNRLHIGVDEGWFAHSDGAGGSDRSQDGEERVIDLTMSE